MPISRSKIIRLKEFVQFSKGQYEFGDSDPHVRLFTHLAKVNSLNLDEKLWLCLLYMAYYQDGSTWRAFSNKQVRNRKELPPLDSPISYQRRNLFGGRIKRHFEAIYKIPSLSKWLDVSSWPALIKRLEELYGNGRWASYTTAEMVSAVALPHIVPTTFEIDDSSGPKSGLQFLGLQETEYAAFYIKGILKGYKLDAPIQMVESFLCNWSRINKADFYLGYNFDRQQARILKIEKLFGEKYKALWDARVKIFDKRVLGEHNGWEGADKKRVKVYADTGKVLMPWEGR